jgi:penicillin-binding protein 1A
MRMAPSLGSFDRLDRRFVRAARGLADHVRSGWRFARARTSGLRVAHRISRLRVAHPVATLAATAGAVAVGYLVYCIATLPMDGGMVVEPTPSALVVQAGNGKVFASRGIYKGDKLSAQDVPDHLARAVVAIEDRKFYQHRGIYPPALLRAAYRNVTAGGVREGGSTITQQLARIAYLSPERTFKRKVQEAMLALWLEHRLSKEEILTRYLNTAYFGANAYGVDAAAKRYFGKPAKDVSLGEAAMLAGLVRAPSVLAPHRNLEGARQRAGLVLDAMVETGAISRKQADAARQQPVTLQVPPDTPPGTNYFVDMIDAEARRSVDSTTDLTLRSTLDLDLQSIAESVIANRLRIEGRAKKVGQAALVAMTPDGAILAMVGGRDYDESQFNRVTQAKRQPGSLFKTFVYLAALERGLNPQMIMIDRPIQIGEWEPENYGGRFRGGVTVHSAFANSINSIAVQISEAVGVRSVIDTARRLGVQSELPAVPSLALGSAEVTLLEMTAAFAAIAANAEKVEPYAIRTIHHGDHVLFKRSNATLAPARNPDARAEIRDLLAGVVREGTGRAARMSGPVAGKTGTSQEHRDAWFIGFTPDLVVGVWVGNDDNKPTKSVTGGDLPTRIWHEFVTRAAAARSKVARAQLATTGIGGGADPRPAAGMAAIRGVAVVMDTATLSLQGRVVRLYGVEGVGGRARSDFRRYLGRRQIVCEQVGSRDSYRCHVDDQDLSRVVLFNGGGRAAADATPELKAAEQQARAARLGIWHAGNGERQLISWPGGSA